MTSWSTVILDKIRVTHSLTQEIPLPFMKPEGWLPCPQNPPLVPVLSQITWSPHLPTLFPKILSNIIFPSTPRSSKLSVCSCFRPKFVCVSHLSYSCYMPRPSHTLDLITLIIFGEALCSLYQPSAAFSLLGHQMTIRKLPVVWNVCNFCLECETKKQQQTAYLTSLFFSDN
jgi:hypothetical protein